ncbi:MAG: hypothetical protein V3S89_02440 [Desulfobacterales bacterium]
MNSGKHVSAVTEDPVAERIINRVDRRSLATRRGPYNLNYLTTGGVEKRFGQERRQQRVESRKGWVRVTEWTSAVVGASLRQKSTQEIYPL